MGQNRGEARASSRFWPSLDGVKPTVLGALAVVRLALDLEGTILQPLQGSLYRGQGLAVSLGF